MRIVSLNASETNLTSASNVAFAKLVRVYNSGGSDLLITQKNAGGNTLATVTLKTKDVMFIRKDARDTLQGGAALKVVSIDFS